MAKRKSENDGPRRATKRELREFVDRFRITKGKGFRLSDIDPGDHDTLEEFGIEEPEEEAKEILERGVKRLADLQDQLYAQDRWAVLCIFQAMDAAGKDGAIKHVMSGVNPQGVQVFSFKAPSSEDLDHDYMWRCMKALPERGRIGIFNRSYYEEVLVARVHPEILAAQKLAPKLVTKEVFEERYEDINAIERYLARNGVVIRKFFLHVSKAEQKRRFLSRLEEPEKNWKFSAADVRERGHWKDYQRAYEDMIRVTATKHAPWIVVPADHKWFSRIVVAAAIIEALEGLDLHYPVVGPEQKRQLAAARRQLLRER
jgi:PPK2 family polyphosphate:nucleotide phosphotransferase